jgi:pimeloyl-ACP methyl ester carboxylesterase
MRRMRESASGNGYGAARVFGAMVAATLACSTAFGVGAGCVGSGDDATDAASPTPSTTTTVDASTSDAGPSIDAECPVVVSDTNCDKSQRPIVFVHGTYGSGDNIANVAMLFASNGYCPDRFVSIDYDSLIAIGTAVTGGAFNGPEDAASEPIDDAIDAVLAANPGFSQVDIMGHSQGALQLYTYLQDPAHAAKVAHYVQLAGGPQSASPGPPDASVPTLSISSNGDVVAGPIGVTGAQQTVVFETQDHMAVAGSTDTFVAIWQYLHQGADGGPDGQYPQYTSIQCGGPTITLMGKSETFGDNSVPAGGTLEVYDLTSPQEDGGAPLMTFTWNDAGVIGPWQANRLTQYEFRGLAADGGIIGHSYFQPFKRSDYWLRFLIPSSDPLAAFITNPVTNLGDNKEVTLIARRAPGAFRNDLGDTLTVNGFEALNNVDATRQSVTVALFMYDANKDGTSQGGSVASFDAIPYFLRATDVYVASSPAAFVPITLNGYTMQIPNWPSVSGGLTYVYFQQ